MLLAEYKNIKYHRFLSEDFDESLNKHLIENFDYSFVVSYGDFLSNNYSVVQKNSVLIDLNKDIDQVFSSFSSISRNQIRRFDRDDLLTFHNSVKNKNFFYKFYSNCEKARGWYPISQSELFIGYLLCMLQ